MVVETESGTLRQLNLAAVWLYQTEKRFRDIAATEFVARIPGNSLVICQCVDETRTLILDAHAHVGVMYPSGSRRIWHS